MSATQFLALLAASVNEEEYVVWGTLDSGISALANVLSRSSDPDLRTRFDAFIVKTLKPVAERLGWEAKPDEGEEISRWKGNGHGCRLADVHVAGAHSRSHGQMRG